MSKPKRIDRIVIYYSDGTEQELTTPESIREWIEQRAKAALSRRNSANASELRKLKGKEEEIFKDLLEHEHPRKAGRLKQGAMKALARKYGVSEQGLRNAIDRLLS